MPGGSEVNAPRNRSFYSVPMGFTEIIGFTENPVEGVLFMELRLG